MSEHGTLTLKFSSDITGASQMAQTKDQLDIGPFSFTMSHPGAVDYGNSGMAYIGKVALQEVAISMEHDKSAPQLMQFSAEGKVFDSVTITAWGQDATKQLIARQILTLKSVMIGSVVVEMLPEGGPHVHFTLCYRARDYEYVPVNAKNEKQPSVKTSYDQATTAGM